ncbi:hypothetical protein WUBG_13783 [Wuchereria bancrofti]|uniref:Laminin G domain-containing protein n=1 Tax=Wuchereria bancrofti TaxID=6293 RepID=J9EIT5_WUCBA|nr:hypothetical protein WUBG_13783 [Wuchereria bancrofti]
MSPVITTKCSKCNCDNGGTTSDYGLMTGDQVPIRGIYRLSDPSIDKGYMTLDPLICSGSAGQSDAYTMTIRKQFSAAEIGIWNGNMLSFEFRTYLESATLLSSNDAFITITMLERTFYLQIDNQINLSLIPQSRFDEMKTWFTSISNEFFGGFGGINGTCPCDNNKCSSKRFFLNN